MSELKERKSWKTCPDCQFDYQSAECPDCAIEAARAELGEMQKTLKWKLQVQRDAEELVQHLTKEVSDLKELISILGRCPYPLHDHMARPTWEKICEIANDT